MGKKTSRKTAASKDNRGMREFLVSPNTVINGILWLVGFTMQIGGWVNQPIAYALLGGAFFWSTCTIIYWWKYKWGNKQIRIGATLVIVAIVCVAMALIVTHPTQIRPKLRIVFDSSSYVIPTGEIWFHIENKGQSTAYQYYATMFGAPENQLQEVIKATPNLGTGSLDPGEPDRSLATFNLPSPAKGVWYIYYKLVYSDSAIGGHFYADDFPYWLSCDFSNPQKPFIELTIAQRDDFKKAIKAYYPDEDIK